MQTTFEFTLPHGYIDDEGNEHQKGVMRLSRAIDEIVPLRDPRVQANPAYATVIILARVIEGLGTLPEVSPSMVENFFAGDLSYLQDFYRHINKLEEKSQGAQTPQGPQVSQVPPSPPVPQVAQTMHNSQGHQTLQVPQETASASVSHPSHQEELATQTSTFTPPQSFVPNPEQPDSLAKAIQMTVGGKRR